MVLSAAALLVSSAAGGTPGSYQERGAILTFTRDDIEFESDGYPEDLEGTQICTLCGILGGENTFWLILKGKGFCEYDLDGRPLRIVGFPVVRRVGPSSRDIVTPEGICVLRDKGGRWRKRMSFQVYSFADSAWSAPVRIPDSPQFTSPRGAMHLVVRDGDVWIFDSMKKLGIPISRGGRYLTAIDTKDIEAMNPDYCGPAAVNGSGLVMYAADVSLDQFVDYRIVDGSGGILGMLRMISGTVGKGPGNREMGARQRWAILGDGTVLKLRTRVRGEPDDKVEVIRWAP